MLCESRDFETVLQYKLFIFSFIQLSHTSFFSKAFFVTCLKNPYFCRRVKSISVSLSPLFYAFLVKALKVISAFLSEDVVPTLNDK